MTSGESRFDNTENRAFRKSWNLLEDFLADEPIDSVIIEALQDYVDYEQIRQKLGTIRLNLSQLDEEKKAFASFYTSQIRREETKLDKKGSEIKTKRDGLNGSEYSSIYAPNSIVQQYWNAFAEDIGLDEALDPKYVENTQFIASLGDDLQAIIALKQS